MGIVYPPSLPAKRGGKEGLWGGPLVGARLLVGGRLGAGGRLGVEGRGDSASDGARADNGDGEDEGDVSSKARSAAAKTATPSVFAGSRANTAWAHRRTSSQSNWEIAASASSSNRSICRRIRSLGMALVPNGDLRLQDAICGCGHTDIKRIVLSSNWSAIQHRVQSSSAVKLAFSLVCQYTQANFGQQGSPSSPTVRRRRSAGIVPARRHLSQLRLFSFQGPGLAPD